MDINDSAELLYTGTHIENTDAVFLNCTVTASVVLDSELLEGRVLVEYHDGTVSAAVFYNI